MDVYPESELASLKVILESSKIIAVGIQILTNDTNKMNWCPIMYETDICMHFPTDRVVYLLVANRTLVTVTKMEAN